MAEFSSECWRSTKSFVTSFLIHLALIICLSLFFVDFGGRNLISLIVPPADEADQLQQLETPEFELSADEMSFMDPAVSDESMEVEDLMDEWVPPAESYEEGYAPFDFPSEFVSQIGNGEEGSDKGFFGIEATGDRIVYVIDMSISMRYQSYHHRRYDRAVNEVLKSIAQLKPHQKFYVYLFCFDHREMKIGQQPGEFCEPSIENQNKLKRWLDRIQLGPGTDPRVSLVAALQTEPSCVYLLSDGEFNGVEYNNGYYGRRTTAVKLAKANNVTSCPIHTIGLEDRGNQRALTLIAEESGGDYRFVTSKDN